MPAQQAESSAVDAASMFFVTTRSLTLTFSVVAEHTGVAGVRVPLARTIADCEGFIGGKFDSLSEADCYMRGGMPT